MEACETHKPADPVPAHLTIGPAVIPASKRAKVEDDTEDDPESSSASPHGNDQISADCQMGSSSIPPVNAARMEEMHWQKSKQAGLTFLLNERRGFVAKDAPVDAGGVEQPAEEQK